MSTLDDEILQARHTRLYLDTKEDVLRRKFQKLLSESLDIDLKEGKCTDKYLQQVYDDLQTKKQQRYAPQYFFITICPYEDVDIESLKKVVEKCVKKKWMTSYIYVYEQRQTEIGLPYFGIHSHMIVKRGTIAKSDVIREIYNTSKSICGSKQSIDVKLLKNDEDLKVRLNYILGEKSTKEKRQRQEIDKIFRQNNNLLSYYSKDFDAEALFSTKT